MSRSLEQVTQQIKALADPTRLRALILLHGKGEVCVCEIAEYLDEPEFKVSRHLAVLRKAGLVSVRRKGVWMHYSLAELREPVEAALAGVIESASLELDAALTASADSCCKAAGE